MNTYIPLLFFVSLLYLVTSCGPNPSSSSDTQTTKTTTTEVTSTVTPPAPPAITATVSTPPPPPPAVVNPALTQANLDRIQDGMSQGQVETILGAPTSSESEPIPIVGGTQTTYYYQSGTASVTIIFKNNQVKQKSGTFGT